MSKSIRVIPEDAIHNYGVLFANEEGAWVFAHVDDEGKETTLNEKFNGPLSALRALGVKGWEVVNAYSVEKRPGLNGDRFLLRKQMPKSKNRTRIGYQLG